MPTLPEKLLAPAVRPQVVADCAKLVDDEVSDKFGLGGLAIKGAYAVVKAVKGGVIPEVIDGLLPDFAAKLDPLYQEWLGSGDDDFAFYLKARAPQVAEALLTITDARAEKSKNATMRKAYEKLRPTGKKNVEVAVPRLGALLAKHAPR